MDIKKTNEEQGEDDYLSERKILYTNANGNIYEGDTVQCFDVVAWHITCLTGHELTQKMISNARVLKIEK